MAEIKIFWDDLKQEVKENIAEIKNKSVEELEKENNFEVIPIGIINF